MERTDRPHTLHVVKHVQWILWISHLKAVHLLQWSHLLWHIIVTKATVYVRVFHRGYIFCEFGQGSNGLDPSPSLLRIGFLPYNPWTLLLTWFFFSNPWQPVVLFSLHSFAFSHLSSGWNIQSGAFPAGFLNFIDVIPTVSEWLTNLFLVIE